MKDERSPKGPSIQVGEEFNDDEATVLDVSLDALQEQLRAREQAADAKTRPSADKKRPLPPSVADDDLEKTEMLDRPDLEALDEGSSKAAPRGVVPLGSDAARLLGKSNSPRGEREAGATDTPAVPHTSGDRSGDDDDDAETVLLSRPAPRDDDPTDPPSAAPSSEPNIRALDAVSFPPVLNEVADDKTLSRPKIARMKFRPSDLPAVGGEGAAFADTQKREQAGAASKRVPPRPLPPPPGPSKPRPHVSRTSPLGDDAAQREGRLIIDAPAEAVVFIDGAERGGGMVNVEGVDRFGRVAVRVHLTGYKPWTRRISLDGEVELRITPELEPR